jgi:hypothetical protein
LGAQATIGLSALSDAAEAAALATADGVRKLTDTISANVAVSEPSVSPKEAKFGFTTTI